MTQDTLLALRRLKRDLYVVGATASEWGSADDRLVLRLILRNAADGALRAFNAGGPHRDAAWQHMVLLVDELLRHRGFLPVKADRAELRRLRAFVNENRDALEPSVRLSVVRSVAI